MLLHEAIGIRSKDPGNYPAMITTILAHVPLGLPEWASTRHWKYISVI